MQTEFYTGSFKLTSFTVKCNEFSLLSLINLFAALRLFLYGVTLVFPDHSLSEVSQPAIIALVGSLFSTVWFSLLQYGAV